MKFSSNQHKFLIQKNIWTKNAFNHLKLISRRIRSCREAGYTSTEKYLIKQLYQASKVLKFLLENPFFVRNEELYKESINAPHTSKEWKDKVEFLHKI